MSTAECTLDKELCPHGIEGEGCQECLDDLEQAKEADAQIRTVRTTHCVCDNEIYWLEVPPGFPALPASTAAKRARKRTGSKRAKAAKTIQAWALNMAFSWPMTCYEG